VSKRIHDSVAIFSGGLDSTVLVYEMMQQGLNPHLLSFNYGQRHVKELDYAARTAERLNLRHDIVDLTGITHLISNSALTSPQYVGADLAGNFIEVPEGHYAEDNMQLTVVPNRNMIMLSIAAGVMVNNGYRLIGTGVHSGDHFVYPDCRPRFLNAVNASIVIGNEGFGCIPKQEEGTEVTGVIYAPFHGQSKADIALKGIYLYVPFEDTWSCYKGGDIHCGKCGTCVERLEAIAEAQERVNENYGENLQYDNTSYEDTEYWKGVVADAKAATDEPASSQPRSL